jgi:hypothetical protein
VTWLARWKASGLSYDVLRLALWPGAPALDVRLMEIVESLSRFAVADQDRHDLGTLDDVDDTDRELYLHWSDGWAEGDQIRELVSRAGVDDPEQQVQQIAFLQTATPESILRTASEAASLDLAAFIYRFRVAAGQYQEPMNETFLTYPLGLVRIVVRELHRWRLSQSG